MFRAFNDDSKAGPGKFIQLTYDDQQIWTVADGDVTTYLYGEGLYDQANSTWGLDDTGWPSQPDNGFSSPGVTGWENDQEPQGF